MDGPNPKLRGPWRGSCVIQSRSSPVAHQAKSPNSDARVDVVHLTHLRHIMLSRGRLRPISCNVRVCFMGGDKALFLLSIKTSNLTWIRVS